MGNLNQPNLKIKMLEQNTYIITRKTEGKE